MIIHRMTFDIAVEKGAPDVYTIEQIIQRSIREVGFVVGAEGIGNCRNCQSLHKWEVDRRAIIAGASMADALKEENAKLRECLQEAVNNECNFCRTVRKDGTYGKCEHLKEDGECDHLRGVKCIVHKWRKALEGETK